MCLKGESPNEIRKVVLYDHFKIQSQIQEKNYYVFVTSFYATSQCGRYNIFETK